MFSGFYQTIAQSASIILSPKAILSEVIAQALSVYFIVDPALIESNLLSDTKVILRNVQLKPLLLNSSYIHKKQQGQQEHHQKRKDLYLIGTVSEIEFKWTWGSATDRSTSYVHDTQLLINGGQFRIIVQDHVVNDEISATKIDDSSTSCETTTTTTTATTCTQVNKGTGTNTNTESTLSTYVSQIIDHLSFQIKDIEAIIDVDDDSLLVLNVNEILLVSHGKQSQSDNDPSTQHLLQRLTIGKITGSVHNKVNNDVPLSCIELCGYTATIKRLCGQRFIGGVWTGLDINGQTLSDGVNNGTGKSHDLLHVNGGTKQIQVLLKILNKLKDIVQTNNSCNSNSNNNTSDSNSTDTTSSGGIYDSTNVCDNDTMTTTLLSTFRLQIPGIQITVPNGATVIVPPSWLQYDGTRILITGSDNILINESFPAIKLLQNTQWSMQIPLSTDSSGTSNDQEQNIHFQLSSNTSKKIVNEALVIVHYHNKEMNHLIQGFVDAFELVRYDKLTALLLEEYEKSSTEVRSNETSAAINGRQSNTTTMKKKRIVNIELNGNIVLKLESEKNAIKHATTDWIDIVILPLTTVVTIDNTCTAVSAMQGDGINIYESSYGDTFAISVPPFDMYPQQPFVTLKDTVIVKSESLQQLHHLRQFIRSLAPKVSFSNFDTTTLGTQGTNFTTPKRGHTKQIKIPMSIKIPKVKIVVSESNSILSIQDLSIVQNSNSRLNIERIELESDVHSISISGIFASTEGVEVGQIDKCTIGRVGRLVEPLVSISCCFSGTGVIVTAPCILFKIENDEGDGTSTKNASKKVTNINVPFDVTVTIQEIAVILADKNTTKIDNLRVSFKPVGNDEVDLALGENAVKAQVSIQNVQHTELMKLTKFYGSGVVYNGHCWSIHESFISVENVDVVSGFSTVDWKRMIGRGAKAKRVPFYLPYVQVASFDVSVSYKGHIVSSESNIIPVVAFVGSKETTSEDLTKHIARAIVSRAPAFLTNATLAGLNIVDSLSTKAGQTITGTVTGSIDGVVDAVNNTISQGKCSRGVASDSKYRLGDFARGKIHKMKNAREAGISGKGESMNQCTLDNKSHSAGASGSLIVMKVRTAAAGSIGFLANVTKRSNRSNRADSDVSYQD